jgi:hypothetical protein
MPAPRRYPAELRQRAVRLVLETRDQQSGETVRGAVLRVGRQLGVNPGTFARLGPPGGDRPGQLSWGGHRGVGTGQGARA